MDDTVEVAFAKRVHAGAEISDSWKHNTRRRSNDISRVGQDCVCSERTERFLRRVKISDAVVNDGNRHKTFLKRPRITARLSSMAQIHPRLGLHLSATSQAP